MENGWKARLGGISVGSRGSIHRVGRSEKA